jgi:hypothetical protein
MPDASRAAFSSPSALIPGDDRNPGFDLAYGISTRHRRISLAGLSRPYLTGFDPALRRNAVESNVLMSMTLSFDGMAKK